ncbi:hypothetical protein [Neobacillus mesonae]|uniref:hypothetical protein n=1 Tax=Neobacillus mesonae TaxID=1193713 RepID=UPI002E21210F|nr:hypothetical protein [Neobacillus mesonae]
MYPMKAIGDKTLLEKERSVSNEGCWRQNSIGKGAKCYQSWLLATKLKEKKGEVYPMKAIGDKTQGEKGKSVSNESY